MSFKPILKDLVEKVNGAHGAILLDWEGEAVDQYTVLSDYEIKFIGAHMGIILYNLKKRLKKEMDDDVRGVTIDMGAKRFIVYPVDKDYFAVFVLSPGTVLGLAMHEMAEAVKEIKKAF